MASSWERTRGSFEESFVNACLTPQERDGGNNSTNDPGYTIRKLLVSIVRAWTRDGKGGVIVKFDNGNLSLFQAIEFYGPVNNPLSVDIQYCEGPTLSQARAFLRGEEIEEIEVSRETSLKFLEHVKKSVRSTGNCDLGSGLLLYQGRLKPISPLNHVAGRSPSSVSSTTTNTAAAASAPASSTPPPPVRREICCRPGCSKTQTSEGKKLLVCSRCTALYCSTQCQKQDWKAHKRVCKKWRLSLTVKIQCNLEWREQYPIIANLSGVISSLRSI